MKKKQFRKGRKGPTGLARLIAALIVTNGVAVLLCMALAAIIQKGSVSLTVGGYIVYAIEFLCMLLGCFIAAGAVPEKRGAGIGILVGLQLVILVLLNLGLPGMDQSRLPWGLLATAIAGLPVLLMKKRRRSAFRI